MRRLCIILALVASLARGQKALEDIPPIKSEAESFFGPLTREETEHRGKRGPMPPELLIKETTSRLPQEPSKVKEGTWFGPVDKPVLDGVEKPGLHPEAYVSIKDLPRGPQSSPSFFNPRSLGPGSARRLRGSADGEATDGEADKENSWTTTQQQQLQGLQGFVNVKTPMGEGQNPIRARAARRGWGRA